jgi:hypothetical protein
MWEEEDRISRYSVQYMLSDVGSCWSRGHAFSQSDGEDEGRRHKRACAAAGRSGPNTFRADPFLDPLRRVLAKSDKKGQHLRYTDTELDSMFRM